MEGDGDANTAERGTGRAKEGGGEILGALAVVTLALSKDATTVDEGATTGPTKAIGALTSAVGATS